MILIGNHTPTYRFYHGATFAQDGYIRDCDAFGVDVDFNNYYVYSRHARGCIGSTKSLIAALRMLDDFVP